MAKKQEIKLDPKLAEIAEKEPDFSILNDHPLCGDDINYEDFNLNYHLGPIYDILRSTDTKPPMAIAIYGDWGTGKTTAMRWLEAMLTHWNSYGKVSEGKKILVKPVWFFPWKYDNKEDVWRGLIAEVILQSIMVTDANLGTVTKAAKQFGLFLGKSFLHSLSCLSINIPGLKAEGKDVASAIREVVHEFHAINRPEKAYLNEFESTLKSWINDTVKGDKRLVVFVDDLDRCMPDVALEVLEALKLYLNIEKMIFVVGVDRVVIERLVRRHYIEQGFDENNELDRAKFKTYLQKIFQVEVNLVPTVQQMEGFLENCLDRHVPAWKKLLTEEHQDIFKKLIRFYGKRTPREVKRLINSSLREGVGAIKVTTDVTDETIKKLTCAQGMQIHFLREELIRQYRQTEILGDNGDGDEFFRTWSRIVVNNYNKDKSFPCTIDKTILEGFRGGVEDEEKREESRSGTKPLAKAETETEHENEQFKSPKELKEYQELLTNARFVQYQYLLDNRQIGEMMKIPYPAKDSPLLVNAAAISRTIEAETSDEKLILERISRQLDKAVNEIGDKDLDELTSLNLSSAKISNYSFLSRLKSLKDLDLEDNKLTIMPESIFKLTTLQTLNLDKNQLTTLPEAIAKLTALQRLDLDGNQLTDLPEAVCHLTKLETLYCRNNQLTTLPEAIAKLTALRDLHLQGDQLDTLPEAIFKLTALQELWLDSNQLTTVPEEIGKLTDLQNLRLYGNQLTTVPEAIGKLTDLQTLDLRDNQLTTVPEEIGNLTSLKQLWLKGNQLTTVPEAIGKLTDLQTLDLRDNQLTTVPEAIGKLTALKDLYLSSNQLTTVPEEIGELAALQRLNLTHNQLTTLPESIGELTALQNLVLNNNQLTTVPEAICKLTALQKLYLDNNRLTTVPEAIGKLTALQELDLRNNQLTSLPEAIGSLKNLELLQLHGNRLTALPDSLCNLNALNDLDLSDSQLITLPEAIGNLKKLKSLNLHGNNFSEDEKNRIKSLLPNCDIRF